MIKDKLTQDLKEALLARDAERATVLRGLKSVILDAEIAAGARDRGLSDEAIIGLFQKEAKKRQESADLYLQAGDQARTDKELAEKTIIETYLPAQLTEEEIATAVDEVIAETGASGMQAMGQVIGAVKAKTKGAADGAITARIVKEKLNS